MEILAVCCGKGATHDLTLLKQDAPMIHPNIEALLDSGYQGYQHLHAQTKIPYKKRKNNPLTDQQKQYNRELASLRIKVEHVNRRCKIFRCVKETYRGKHKNYTKTWKLVSALVNLRYA